MIQHDPVDVIDNLRFVTKLNRFAETALRDRARVAVMQRHDPCGAVGYGTAEANTCLCAYPAKGSRGRFEFRDQRGGFARRCVTDATHATAGVSRDRDSVRDRRFSNSGHLGGDRIHLGFRVVAAAPQPRTDRMRPCPHRPGPVTRRGPQRVAGCFQRSNKDNETRHAFRE